MLSCHVDLVTFVSPSMRALENGESESECISCALLSKKDFGRFVTLILSGFLFRVAGSQGRRVNASKVEVIRHH